METEKVCDLGGALAGCDAYIFSENFSGKGWLKWATEK